MLGRLGNDLDFTTNARPEAVLRLLNRWAESTGTSAFDSGTVGALKDGYQIEVTTYRAESYDVESRNRSWISGTHSPKTSFAVTSRSTPWRSRCRTWASLICTAVWRIWGRDCCEPRTSGGFLR